MAEMQCAKPAQHATVGHRSSEPHGGACAFDLAGGISSHLLAILVHLCSDLFGLRSAPSRASSRSSGAGVAAPFVVSGGARGVILLHESRVRFCRPLLIAASALLLSAVPASAAQSCTGDDECGEFRACISASCCTPTDFDRRCGGDCGVACPDAAVCAANADCKGGACSDGVCCGRGCNGNCGNRCAAGQGCSTGADCRDFGCVGGKCCLPSDIDRQCGGNCGAPCAGGGKCLTDTDCKSGSCQLDLCQ